MTRTCVHCVLRRVLRAEAPALERRGLTVVLRASDAAWLPVPAPRAYREIRGLLRRVRQVATGGSIRIATLGIVPARSHIEILATFRQERGWCTASCLLPRFVEQHLWEGLRA